MKRTYTEQERNAAVARAVQTDDATAAAELGIPRRTVSSWRHRPAQAEVIVRTRQQFAAAYAEAEGLALERVIRILTDPKSRPRDVIDAGEWVSKQRALLAGSPTEIGANLNVNVDGPPKLSSEELDQLRTWLEALDAATDEELLASEGKFVARIRDIERVANPNRHQFHEHPEPTQLDPSDTTAMVELPARSGA